MRDLRHTFFNSFCLLGDEMAHHEGSCWHGIWYDFLSLNIFYISEPLVHFAFYLIPDELHPPTLFLVTLLRCFCDKRPDLIWGWGSHTGRCICGQTPGAFWSAGPCNLALRGCTPSAASSAPAWRAGCTPASPLDALLCQLSCEQTGGTDYFGDNQKLLVSVCSVVTQL